MMEMCEEMEIHATPLLLIDRRDLPAKVATNWQPARSMVFFLKALRRTILRGKKLKK